MKKNYLIFVYFLSVFILFVCTLFLIKIENYLEGYIYNMGTIISHLYEVVSFVIFIFIIFLFPFLTVIFFKKHKLLYGLSYLWITPLVFTLFHYLLDLKFDIPGWQGYLILYCSVFMFNSPLVLLAFCLGMKYLKKRQAT